MTEEQVFIDIFEHLFTVYRFEIVPFRATQLFCILICYIISLDSLPSAIHVRIL